MKLGIRTPSVKKMAKSRTTGVIKRKVKSSVNPLYGKKGMGLVNNPKKAIYNKVYNKTSVSAKDFITNSSNSYSKNDINHNSQNCKNYQSENNKGLNTCKLFIGTILLIFSFLLIFAKTLIGLVFFLIGLVVLLNYASTKNKAKYQPTDIKPYNDTTEITDYIQTLFNKSESNSEKAQKLTNDVSIINKKIIRKNNTINDYTELKNSLENINSEFLSINIENQKILSELKRKNEIYNFEFLKGIIPAMEEYIETTNEFISSNINTIDALQKTIETLDIN